MALSQLMFRSALCVLSWLLVSTPALAEREAVLKQIDLPHNYYYREMYLPQLTNGPSSLAWAPGGDRLVYSMQGSLWVQALDSTSARQVTAGPGYDYQPDWSPDGKSIIFARYLNDEVELYLLNVESGEVSRLTTTGAVNLEPRWSPNGSDVAWVTTSDTGRFHILVGKIHLGRLIGERLQPARQSHTSRVYYSEFDHELSPAWSPDGSELLYVSNPENAYGTGGLWRRGLGADDLPVSVREEETTWKARPDWAPDGKRVIWSSYLGRQWHQLWLTTSAGGGDPLPLSFGEFDITSARWSPDGRTIAYISNETGSTELWLQEIPGGARHHLKALQREYLHPMGSLELQVVDASGAAVAARVAVTGSDGRSYAPDQAWIHGDDEFDRGQSSFETHYFHTYGKATIQLPAGEAQITVWRGLENTIAHETIDIQPKERSTTRIKSLPLDIPPEWKNHWISGDVHVHMNYGGAYRNTPPRLVAQADAEDLDVVFNLIVNKEQRIPDIAWFSTAPDATSNEKVLLLHAQEFHTGYWGHLGLLGLDDHFLLPDYSAYANTGLASPFPDNSTVADLAHQQHALVGYVHPYNDAPDPQNDPVVTNALPIDVALGKVDYYEVSGFSDFRPTQEVWHRLLNCGFRVAAAGGTDAMANYSSLRGPVGLNRVYVLTTPDIGEPGSNEPQSNELQTNELGARRDHWLQGLKAGRTMATNGPILDFEFSGQAPGGELSLPAGEHELKFTGFMRSIVPVDHLEVVLNGEVVQSIKLNNARDSADFSGSLKLTGSGWVVLRAWNDDASPDLFDRFPFATTNPVFIEVDGQPVRSAKDAKYFLSWIARVREQAETNPNYNDETEKQAVLRSIDAASAEFIRRR